MGKFAKYRIHFDITPRTGLLAAHSDYISVEKAEEYIRIFGCGHVRPHSYGTGETDWHADPPGRQENSIRLAWEWLDELEYVYPNKAAVVRGMLNACDPDGQGKPKAA